MDFMSAMEIAAASLRANRLRMNITSSNLANANTTRTAEGGPYRRKDAVFSAAPLPASFGRMLTDRLQQSLRTVEVAGIQTDPRPPRTVYDPGHPDADAKGIVKMPNVNMIEEMVDMITASRAYEAGVTTLGTIKAMADKALQIGEVAMSIDGVGYGLGQAQRLRAQLKELRPIRPPSDDIKPAKVSEAADARSISFAEMLSNVANSENAAQAAAENYALGRTQNLHGTMLSLAKADINFTMLVTVRNKLLEAYREVMRMS